MSEPTKSCSCGGSSNCGTPRVSLNRRGFIQVAAAGGAGLFAQRFATAGPDLSDSEVQQLQSMAHAAAQARYAQPLARGFNEPYAGANLNRIAFPIGGIGAGMFCLEGTGALSHMSVRNTMDVFHEPCTFAAVSVKGEPNIARVLEGPIPDWKYFGRPDTGNGGPGTTYGFPRFREAAFVARFPFATIELRDEALPLRVSLTGWSPFLPNDADNSSLPVGALEYTFHNDSGNTVDAVFSFNTKNFMANGSGSDSVGAFAKGFVLRQAGTPEPQHEGAFGIFVDGEEVVVDHCWFKGGWWDGMTLAWRHVQEATLLDNPAVEGSAPGASLFVPFSVAPGASRTIKLMMAWYVPVTTLRAGDGPAKPAYAAGTATGAAEGQQPVTGFLGKRLLNSFYPDGDGPKGTLVSKPFDIGRRYIHLLVAGSADASQARAELRVAGKAVMKAAGANTEKLAWKSWDVSEFRGQSAAIRLVDESSGGWGHLCVDHIVFSDLPIEDLKVADGNALREGAGVEIFEDFESAQFDRWTLEKPEEVGCPDGTCKPVAEYYSPWYAGRFAHVEDVAAYWRTHYAELREGSALFRDTFYDSSLPPEVLEAVAANLTILKSPTVLRQADGRLWCWEGCSDKSGCCHGSCTHVWNYAQAIAHLFPALERSLRHTEFHENQFSSGQQAFRANLPIRHGGTPFEASDGQLGGLLKLYREWRISGDDGWLRAYWPQARKSLDFLIAKLDPRETGLLEESHHNTYDINYFGPDGHTGSFYLGALAAAVRMGDYLKDDVTRYRALLQKGTARLERELYNGEYFYQKIMTEGLNSPPPRLNPDDNSAGYRATVDLLNQQGPQYQYGTGCLSDGVLGFWMARMCGIDEALADEEKVRSHLASVHRYNLRRDLSAHANPQRPTYAMGNEGGLLLCSWPRGGALAIPFVYSDEVWTGIEYQVASHLMLLGRVEEGLEIVRLCRARYDGVRRNPFNEYECGHWYARAMSSYGLLQGMTGLRYDAVEKTLYLFGKRGDFHAFLSTESGYGTAGIRNGKPFLDVKSGAIEVMRLGLLDGAEGQ